MKYWIILLCLFTSFGVFAQGNQTREANVLILTTGGTIASRKDAPMVNGSALVVAIPKLKDIANITQEEFSTIGSSKITPAHWLSLAKTINTHFEENKSLTGIVITHGTDTLEETAFFLNLTVKWDKPVVLTGSMKSSDEVSADGPANLINAVKVASNAGAIGQGVLVVLNENITSARDVRKTDNRRVDTFEGGNVGHIGTVDPAGVRFYHKSLHPHTTNSEFDITNISSLPYVPILGDYSGFDESLVEDFTSDEMVGLVIRTFAGGRMSHGMIAGLANLERFDLKVVVTSRVPKGRIVQAPNYPFKAVFSRGLQDNKTRILLMLSLTKTNDMSEIKRMFETY